jgi:hypothetical protein
MAFLSLEIQQIAICGSKIRILGLGKTERSILNVTSDLDQIPYTFEKINEQEKNAPNGFASIENPGQKRFDGVIHGTRNSPQRQP